MTTLINNGPQTKISIPSRPVILNGQGGQGPAGPQGNPGVFVGPTPPSDITLLWVDTSS